MIDGESRYTDAERLFVRATVYDRTGHPQKDSRYGRQYDNRETSYLMTVYPGSLPPRTYMATDVDNMPNLSWAALQDPRKWWVVADANPHIRYPMDLSMGDLVHIPV